MKLGLWRSPEPSVQPRVVGLTGFTVEFLFAFRAGYRGTAL